VNLIFGKKFAESRGLRHFAGPAFRGTNKNGTLSRAVSLT
jgi:hypothetical protein